MNTNFFPQALAANQRAGETILRSFRQNLGNIPSQTTGEHMPNIASAYSSWLRDAAFVQVERKAIEIMKDIVDTHPFLHRVGITEVFWQLSHSNNGSAVGNMRTLVDSFLSAMANSGILVSGSCRTDGTTLFVYNIRKRLRTDKARAVRDRYVRMLSHRLQVPMSTTLEHLRMNVSPLVTPVSNSALIDLASNLHGADGAVAPEVGSRDSSITERVSHVILTPQQYEASLRFALAAKVIEDICND